MDQQPATATRFDATLQGLALLLGARLPVLRAVATTGSTNSDLLDACRQSQPLPQLLVAERQTAGRGRQGRSWVGEDTATADEAPLSFSLAWPWQGQPSDGLSLAVGSVLAESLDPAGSALRLKWPNDLWLAQRKLGGILIETVVHQGQLRALVVGVGLNLRAPQLELPTAGLRELDPRWTAPLALAAVLPPLVELLDRWQGFSAGWRAAFARRDALRGQRVAGDGVAGRAEGVDASGLLQLRDANGQLRSLRAGEARLQLEADLA